MPGVGWLADWLVFESGPSVRGCRSKAPSLFLSLSLSQRPFYKYQFNDVNVLAEICKHKQTLFSHTFLALLLVLIVVDMIK